MEDHYNKLMEVIDRINKASTLLLRSLSKEQMIEVAKEMSLTELNEILYYYESLEEFEICNAVKAGIDAKAA
ncbi:hypothetical protein [Rubrolithibacter danxiaensis]|uniref:hypothetical protein n=1 Tax=Rubrolithibacter danxiaensis TaxID=3390805 RepID=UPI003BF7BD07